MKIGGKTVEARFICPAADIVSTAAIPSIRNVYSVLEEGARGNRFYRAQGTRRANRGSRYNGARICREGRAIRMQGAHFQGFRNGELEGVKPWQTVTLAIDSVGTRVFRFGGRG